MRTHRIMGALLALLLAAAPAAAQVASAVIVEGGELPGGPANHIVDSINNSAENHAGGFAFTTNSTDGATTLSHVWGTADGTLPGAPLFTEGHYGIYQQNSFESFFGVADDGSACYSPSCDADGGSTGLDGVWLDDTVIAIEEDVYPHLAGYWWSFGSRPGVTADGIPYFVGGITNTQGGSTQIRGFFYGLDASPLVMGGDFIAGPDLPVAPTGLDFDARVSALGSHWISPVNLDTGTGSDGIILIDGAVAMAGGEMLRESAPVPEAIGGLEGEAWDNFDFCGITENGDWMVTGDTDAATNQDEFVMVNGQIVLREGMMLDGNMLAGAIEGAYLNEDGDWAVIWDVDYEALNVEALILNGNLLLKETDLVDFDGDGVVETTSILDNFTGISSLTMSDRDAEGNVKLYFTADVNVPGAPLPSSYEALTDLAAWGLEGPPEPRGDRALLEGGFILPAATITSAESAPAAGHALGANYPNPFNPATRIDFTLGADSHVQLEVLTVDGRRVATLVDGPLAAGPHTATWRGLDDAGNAQPSGVYLYRLSAGDWVESRRMILLK